ncbi:trypsin-1-like [Amyelois transitella]|uniref:trypsin-1-like n=1 Tax=Amyelois transitella TaxID=680683 RepID=UPI00067D5A79|nr:trypsin-1-like [Amyelois transitella]
MRANDSRTKDALEQKKQKVGKRTPAFNVIIIPVSDSQSLFANLKKLQSPKHATRDQYSKLDIESYEEPTDIPDVDNLDLQEERQTNINRELDNVNINDERSFRQERREDFYGRADNFGEDKIVGGTEVDINLYPYHVAYGTNCGGAIIDKKWIITAGHCGKKPYIRVGSKYLNQGRKIMVKSNHIHPMWGASNKDHPFDYDFQLLELNENLKFDSNVQPVKIAHIEDMTIGKVVTVTGWGNTEENGPYSNVLRAVRVPIISKENCQRVPYPYFRGALTSRMFCAGFSEGKKDACQGDSGGPAVAYDRILGMVSFGYGCATPGSYGVYSKIAKVRPWIEEVTKLKLD